MGSTWAASDGSGAIPEKPSRIRDEGPFRKHSGPYNLGMCEHAEPLPEDLGFCHEIIRQQADTIHESQRRIEQLEHQVELLLRRQYGPRRESVDSDQLRLFTEDAPEDVAEGTTEQPPESEEAKPKRRWRRGGRQQGLRTRFLGDLGEHSQEIVVLPARNQAPSGDTL